MTSRMELNRRLAEATARAKSEGRSAADCPKVKALLEALRRLREKLSNADDGE